MKALQNRGDTIVEVLIVLAILTFALSISYASATRSLADAQLAQENSYATELAQSQIEEIRVAVIGSLASTSGSISNLSGVTVGGVVQQFCMNLGNDYLATDAAHCQITNGGTTYTINDRLLLSAPTSGGGGPLFFPFTSVNTFEVTITWPDSLNQGTDTDKLFYKVYPQP
jgi:type II secretory pathway pseudopilin PulG